MGWGPADYRYTIYPQQYVIAPPARRGLSFSREELKHILLSCGALIAAFSLAFLNPLFGTLPPPAGIAEVVLGAAVAVLTGFFLHELAHKVVAQRYGAWAEFRSSRTGLIFAIVTGLLGIVFAAPGAVYIAGPLTRNQNGKVSVVGPFTNFVLGLAFLGAWLGVRGAGGGDIMGYVRSVFFLTAYINVFLGGFNMIPIPPLDGQKVLAWNPAVWIALLVGIGAVFVFVFLPRLFFGP